MRLLSAFALLLLALLPIAAAQEGAPPNPAQADPALSPELVARYEQMAAELDKGVPKREITIKTVPPQQTKLFRADPKLLENRFVAEFALHRAGSILQRISSSKVASMLLASQFVQRTNEPLRTQLKYLLDQCPADSRPDKRMIDFLTSEDCDRDVRHTGMWRGFSEIELTFRVFA